MNDIECPWIVCEFNTENVAGKVGKCKFEGKITLSTPDGPSDESDLHEECLKCDCYKPMRDKVTGWKTS